MNRKLIVIIGLLLMVSCVSAIENRSYIAEETAIPFEVFVVLVGIGICFLLCAAATGFARIGGLTIVLGLLSTGFLSVAAFASPTTGFYSYVSVVNTTSNATEITPMVWLILQPWMMWLLWGLATIAFLLFVLGILNLFREQKDAEEMYWI